MNKLPEVNANVVVGYDKEAKTYIHQKILVEVLTVNFNTGTMRVRYKADIWNKGKMETCTPDISSEPFLTGYRVFEA